MEQRTFNLDGPDIPKNSFGVSSRHAKALGMHMMSHRMIPLKVNLIK